MVYLCKLSGPGEAIFKTEGCMHLWSLKKKRELCAKSRSIQKNSLARFRRAKIIPALLGGKGWSFALHFFANKALSWEEKRARKKGKARVKKKPAGLKKFFDTEKKNRVDPLATTWEVHQVRRNKEKLLKN